MKMVNIAIISAFLFSASMAQAEGDSLHHSGQASKHSALAAAHGVASTAKTASAVIAVPLVVAGSVTMAIGNASLEAGASLAEAASKKGPLVITETTVTADPAPNQVIIIQNNVKTKQQ